MGPHPRQLPVPTNLSRRCRKMVMGWWLKETILKKDLASVKEAISSGEVTFSKKPTKHFIIKKHFKPRKHQPQIAMIAVK